MVAATTQRYEGCPRRWTRDFAVRVSALRIAVGNARIPNGSEIRRGIDRSARRRTDSALLTIHKAFENKLGDADEAMVDAISAACLDNATHLHVIDNLPDNPNEPRYTTPGCS